VVSFLAGGAGGKLADVLLLDVLKPLVDIMRSGFADRRHVRVTVHHAFFAATERPAYFVNITNLSRNRDVEITHVWFDVTPQVAAMPPDRPLPKRLKPDEVWETWVEANRLPGYLDETVYTLARVRLSNGAVVKSQRNAGVPDQGSVPGGPVTHS